MTVNFSRDEILHYSRHFLLPEVGLAGQRKLKASSVLIIGTGGLGSPVAIYLAAAGVGKIGLVDYDVVERSNLQRQVVHDTRSIGRLKVESARDRLNDINPLIEVVTYNKPFLSSNAMEISDPYDVIVDGSDNFPTRYLSNDLCVLTGKPNIYGAVFRFDGQASVFDARKGPCYRCVFPEPPPPGLVPTCADAGVFGILPGTIGTIQATEAIKYLLGLDTSLAGKLLLYNALDMTFETVLLKKNPACPICGKKPTLTRLIDYEEFCGVPGRSNEQYYADADWELDVNELNKKIKSGHPLFLIDVREPHELEISSFPSAKNIPFYELPSRISEIVKEGEIVLFCRSGSRSHKALELLRSAGYKNVKNLKGGINAWGREIDDTIQVY